MLTIDSGTRLDHYIVQDLLARGKEASIFHGVDSRTGQPVAIKVPHPEFEGLLTRGADGVLTYEAPGARRRLALTFLRDEPGSFDASIWSL